MGSKKLKEKRACLGRLPKKSLQDIEDARKANQRQCKQRSHLNHCLSNVVREEVDIITTLIQPKAIMHAREQQKVAHDLVVHVNEVVTIQPRPNSIKIYYGEVLSQSTCQVQHTKIYSTSKTSHCTMRSSSQNDQIFGRNQTSLFQCQVGIKTCNLGSYY